MRILGVEKKWPKLRQSEFTTFRFSRRDKDWEVDEEVQVVYKPRSKEREVLGIARIKDKCARMLVNNPVSPVGEVSEGEAVADGFEFKKAMQVWMWDRYKRRIFDEPINKLTLKWVCRFTQL